MAQLQGKIEQVCPNRGERVEAILFVYLLQRCKMDGIPLRSDVIWVLGKTFT